MVFIEDFGTFEGRNAKLYVLKNDYLEVGITDFGGIIQRFIVNSKVGKKDIVCSETSCEEYVKADAHMGGTIGRVANRIAEGLFRLNDKNYQLDRNAGGACLHGGFEPYDYRFFDATVGDDSLTLSLFSPDMDQGFPGNLQFTVKFTLKENKLTVNFEGVSDKDTLFNPTNHAYFNLNGEGSGTIYHSMMAIYSDKITLADENLVVTGDVMDVKGTPFDFRRLKTIAPDIFSDDKNVMLAGGFDHNFILNSNHAATAFGERTGIVLDVYTDLPGVQFYSGNMMKNIKGKSLYNMHEAFCLEPQYFPNAINCLDFEAPILKAGEKAEHYIEYVITEE